jgi:hypothetical protein
MEKFMITRLPANTAAILQAAATLVSGRISGAMSTGVDSAAIDTGLWLIEAMYLVEGVVAEFEDNRKFKSVD